MRHDYAQFQARGVEIIAIGPDEANAFQRFWSENEIPFPGCADPGSHVAAQFHQQVNWLKLGRMPALLVIDPQGRIRYGHYGNSMSDIPRNEEMLKLIDELSA